MNEKDTIIKLQSEVNEGLKKELRTAYYCGEKLSEKCLKLAKQNKRDSKLYYIMGIGTGIVICDFVYKLIASREEKRLNTLEEENQSNE